ncbi:MAG TPA: hypothetical protein VFH50_07190 [Acidimicrobiales bacterium]|nr:hypothetical protein [Acidimicrobiales bacterium]
MASRRQWRRVFITAIVVGALAGCGAATPSGSPPTTTAPPTTVAGCPRFGSTTASGQPAVRPSGLVLLRNVQIQASACVDEVSFLFWKGTPSWSTGYQDGALTLDPSGQPAPVPGTAHLVIRFQHASGTDLSVSPTQQAYDGPTEMTPGAPSALAGLRRLGDFEGVVTWALGLPERRPFEVVTRGDHIVVRVGAATPRATSCDASGSGLRVGYPTDWYAELSTRWACRYFDPAPFVVYPATDATDWAVTVATAEAPAASVVSRTTAGATTRSHQTRVAGLATTVLDVTTTGPGLYPPGWVFRMYVVDTIPTAFVITSRAAPAGAQADRYRAAADRIAGLVTRR